MLAALIEGHDTLADVLFLIAAVLLAICALARAVTPQALPGWVLEVSLAIIAVGWLVL